MRNPVPIRLRAAATALAGAALIALVAGPAAAQMFQKPWSFSPTNRASIAFSLHNDGHSSSGSALAGTSILCGGGSSTAAGNSTCIVLNNANGQIALDQTSEGSQDAANNQLSDIGGGPAGSSSASSPSGVDAVLSILGNEK